MEKLIGIWQTTGRCLVWKIKEQAASKRRKGKDKRREILEKKKRLNK
jgi:hypothetical protein